MGKREDTGMNDLIYCECVSTTDAAHYFLKLLSRCAGVGALMAVTSLTVCGASIMEKAATETPDTPQHLYEQVLAQRGSEALQVVIAAAEALGGWGPAPGDVVIFDPDLSDAIGGAVRFIDTGPVDCVNPKIARRMEDCLIDYSARENWVRLGRAMFVKKTNEASSAPQVVFDDLLATYIEEVGHSWQEYLFETDGLGSGPRLHPTSWEDGNYYQIGWEYQIKRYVLSLDGDVLTLSDEARARLIGDICDADGYANPLKGHVPLYGAPTGWPHAEDWPISAPSPEEAV
ncbi:MAG: hypothetical protein EHM35_20725, partial [Planctomycetaceae bacterium]